MTRGRCSFKVGEFWDLVQCTCTWHTLRIWIFYYQYLISQVDRLMDTDSLLSVFFPVMQFIFFFKKYLFIFRGRGREGERGKETSMWDKHRLVASCTGPKWELNLQLRHVPWPGIKPANFPFAGRYPTEPHQSGQNNSLINNVHHKCTS